MADDVVISEPAAIRPELVQHLVPADSERQRFLVFLAGHSPEQRQFRPAPGEWSMVGVLEHLAEVDRGLYLISRKRLRSPDPAARIRPQGGLRLALLGLAFRLNLSVKNPVQSVNPSGRAGFDELAAEWQGTWTAWSAVLASVTVGQLRQPVFRHPFTGWLTIVQTLRFARSHLGNHWRQVQAIARHDEFPAN